MSDAPIRLRRTSLFVSGASPAHMLQAQFYNEDCLVFDLEDSVPMSGKDAARVLIYNMLKKHRPKNKEVVIRVNALGTVFFEDDIEAAVRARPDGIRLPKVESPQDVHRIDERITAIERKAGIAEGSTRLWCNIETYFGVLRATEIATASPRIVAMAISAEDFTASMRAQRTKQGLEIFHARNMVLLACRAAGIDALDAVFGDFEDLEGLYEDAELGKRLGFDGKTVIHPRQIDVVNKVYTPSEKQIAHAVRVVAAVEEAKRNNKGAVSLDGAMLDEPIVIRARTVLMQARAAGIRIEGVEQ